MERPPIKLPSPYPACAKCESYRVVNLFDGQKMGERVKAYWCPVCKHVDKLCKMLTLDSSQSTATAVDKPKKKPAEKVTKKKGLFSGKREEKPD